LLKEEEERFFLSLFSWILVNFRCMLFQLICTLYEQRF
jgi:hypothetical protein